MQGKFNILIVDDNPKNIQLLASTLKPFGYSLGYSKSGEDALLAINKVSYDLILMDIMMPGIDGLETSRRMKQIKKYKLVPIIFVTAKSSDEDILEGFEAGGVDYITKPFKAKELKVRIETQLKIKELRESLEQKVEEETGKRVNQEKILMQQSKLASMGEMMDAVAHQWKQPLNALSLYNTLLDGDFDGGYVDKEYIKDFSKNINLQIEHMINTLDEFRDFFRPDKKREDFQISSMVESALLLTKDEFLKNRINIKKEIDESLKLYGSKNEMKHLLLNLMNNSKDAFIENSIEKREIIIRVFTKDYYIIMEVEDNAGGIPKKIINDIFKAHITTKKEGKGTGIGLYMSSQIAQKHHGSLSVKNIENGAKFIFKVEASFHSTNLS